MSTILTDIFNAFNPWWDPTWSWEEDPHIQEYEALRKQGLRLKPSIFYTLKKHFIKHIISPDPAESPPPAQRYGILILKGPRRIGKTTLLKLLIREGIIQTRQPRMFAYLSLDEDRLIPHLHEMGLSTLLQQLLRHLHPERRIIFLDEITFYPHWALSLKNLVDKGLLPEHTGILATGSYSLDLAEGKRELAGRTGYYTERIRGRLTLHPYRFSEFISALHTPLPSPIRYLRERSKRESFILSLGMNDIHPILINLKTLYSDENLLSFWKTLREESIRHYFLTGGYPRSIGSFYTTNLTHIPDARYLEDVYTLIIHDISKFKQILFSRVKKPLSDEKIFFLLKEVIRRHSQPAGFLGASSFTNIPHAYTFCNYLQKSFSLSYLPPYDLTSFRDVPSQPYNPPRKYYYTDPFVYWSFTAGSGSPAERKHIFRNTAHRLSQRSLLGSLLEAVILSHLSFYRYFFFLEEEPLLYALFDEDTSSDPHRKNQELADVLLINPFYLDNTHIIPFEISLSAKPKKNIPLLLKKDELRQKGLTFSRVIMINLQGRFEWDEDILYLPAEVFLFLT